MKISEFAKKLLNKRNSIVENYVPHYKNDDYNNEINSVINKYEMLRKRIINDYKLLNEEKYNLVDKLEDKKTNELLRIDEKYGYNELADQNVEMDEAFYHGDPEIKSKSDGALKSKTDGALIGEDEELDEDSGIHIKKKNEGKFSNSAKKAGMSTQDYAHHIMSSKTATPLQKKRANFAINAKKFHHK